MKKYFENLFVSTDSDVARSVLSECKAKYHAFIETATAQEIAQAQHHISKAIDNVNARLLDNAVSAIMHVTENGTTRKATAQEVIKNLAMIKIETDGKSENAIERAVVNAVSCKQWEVSFFNTGSDRIFFNGKKIRSVELKDVIDNMINSLAQNHADMIPTKQDKAQARSAYITEDFENVIRAFMFSAVKARKLPVGDREFADLAESAQAMTDNGSCVFMQESKTAAQKQFYAVNAVMLADHVSIKKEQAQDLYDAFLPIRKSGRREIVTIERAIKIYINFVRCAYNGIEYSILDRAGVFKTDKAQKTTDGDLI
jgi:hypothetical protein